MVASQATEAGSIPVPCSKTKQHPIGMLFLFLEKRKGIEPIQCKCPVGTCRSAAGCRTLLTGLLENALSLRTSAHAGVAIPRIFKHLGRKTKLFPSNRGAATPVTSVTGSQRHTFLTAPAIDFRTLKGPQHGAVDDMHFEPVHLFSPVLPVSGDQKKQGAALWFLSIAQLRCGAYTNRIQIERKVRSFL